MSSVTVLAVTVGTYAQNVVGLPQVKMNQWNIPVANYSGIAPVSDDLYAVVSDKENTDGFYLFTIRIDPVNGAIKYVDRGPLAGNSSPRLDPKGLTLRDCEDIVYHPSTKSFFICGEGDQEVLEYSYKGEPTGRKLNVPAIFSLQSIRSNYGFEALAYSEKTGRFWTTTESTLVADGSNSSILYPKACNQLRIQSFDENLQPVAQYAYRMDSCQTETFGTIFVHGIVAMTALPDGRLLLLEREANIPSGYLGAHTYMKLYEVNPATAPVINDSTKLSVLDASSFLKKTILYSFETELAPFRLTFANYEGMCLGPRLNDGRQTLLLINDSQAGYGNSLYHLKDYLKVLILPDGY